MPEVGVITMVMPALASDGSGVFWVQSDPNTPGSALAADGTFTSHNHLGCTKGEDPAYSAPGPIRSALNGSTQVNLYYDLVESTPGHFTPTMYAQSDGAVATTSMWPADNMQSRPCWQEFDINSAGLAVVMNSTSADGPQLKVSTDYGATWGASIDIDYLKSELGSNYEYLFLYNYSFAVEADDVTDAFYILTGAYYTPVPHYRWVLMKSTNGTTWTHLQTWTDSGSNTTACSLAVNNGHIYCWFTDEYYGGNKVYHSHDDGATWNYSTLPFTVDSTAWGKYVLLAADETTVCANYPNKVAPSASFNQRLTMRSTDGGDSWTQVLQIDVGQPPIASFPEWATFRGTLQTIVQAFCNLQYPDGDLTWEGSDEVEHSGSGEGTAHLAYFISEDSGATWELVETPALTTDGWQQSVGVMSYTAEEETPTPIPPIGPASDNDEYLPAFWHGGYFGIDTPQLFKMFRWGQLVTDQAGFRVMFLLVDHEKSSFRYREIIDFKQHNVPRIPVNRKSRLLQYYIQWPMEDAPANVLELSNSYIPISER